MKIEKSILVFTFHLLLSDKVSKHTHYNLTKTQKLYIT